MATVVNGTLVVPLSTISTPLIFFDPERAYNISIATYVHIASLGVRRVFVQHLHINGYINQGSLNQAIVWDILDNLGSDYKLLSHHKIKLPTVLYFTTR